jgi:hypothetical protein
VNFYLRPNAFDVDIKEAGFFIFSHDGPAFLGVLMEHPIQTINSTIKGSFPMKTINVIPCNFVAHLILFYGN